MASVLHKYVTGRLVEPQANRPSRSSASRRAATRKGAWLYHCDEARKTWRPDGPHFLGHIIHHMVLDP